MGLKSLTKCNSTVYTRDRDFYKSWQNWLQ